MSGCASGFRSINPQKMPFSYTENTTDVQFSYTYDILSLMGNKKYVKKERKHDMHVVAVRVTNKTQKALIFNENLKLIVGNNQMVPVDPTVVGRAIKQGPWIYLLYLPLNFTFTTTNGYGQFENVKETKLPAGLLLSLKNILVVHSANKSFRQELQEFNLMGKTIEPGQTVYGLITLHSLTFDPIKFTIQ